MECSNTSLPQTFGSGGCPLTVTHFSVSLVPDGAFSEVTLMFPWIDASSSDMMLTSASASTLPHSDAELDVDSMSVLLVVSSVGVACDEDSLGDFVSY